MHSSPRTINFSIPLDKGDAEKANANKYKWHKSRSKRYRKNGGIKQKWAKKNWMNRKTEIYVQYQMRPYIGSVAT